MKYLTCISKSLKSVYMILCIRKRAYQRFYLHDQVLGLFSIYLCCKTKNKIVLAGCGAISTQVVPLLLPFIQSPKNIPQTSCRCFRYLYTTMCVYTHNSIPVLIRIMMLMPDCSNCSQVILAKYTMLLSLTHFSDLF